MQFEDGGMVDNEERQQEKPIAALDAGPAASLPSGQNASSASTLWNMAAPLRALLLSESPADAELTIRELERVGFRCHPVVIATRLEFAESLRRFPFDIVLANYWLPGWTGMEAMSMLRYAGLDIPFILITTVLGEEAAVECIKQGITDYVLKEHLARLPLVVTRALEEKALRDARKFMVQALRQSEANSLFLFTHNPLPMWVFERETLQILQVNDAALQHYGYERTDFLQMTAVDLHPAEQADRFLAFLPGHLAESCSAGEWRHHRNDGSIIDVEMLVHHMEYAGHGAVLVVAQDITERKRAERERQKFFTLVENSRDFIAVADLQGNVQYVNPAGRDLLGISCAQAVEGTRTSDYVATEDLPLVRNVIVPGLRSAGHWAGDLRFRHRQTGQSLPMDFLGFIMKDAQSGEPRSIATVSRDMTERRALEQQLRQAQKFEAIGQLAGGIAHDFNNVIGAVLGWAELGEEQAAARDGQLAGYFRKIRAQCDRVTALICQLLAFARRQVLEPRSLDFNQTVLDVLSLLDNVIGKDIEIQTDLDGHVPVVRADPTQIEQVLMNLCINSRDAMPRGGRLTIQTRQAAFAEQDARRTPGIRAGHFAELRVTDTGIGMEESVKEHIFEPFFTTKGPGKGTGLGLATVYGIVEQHGGFILVDSNPGKGTTFRIFLPTQEIARAAGDSSPVVLEEMPIRGGSETILVAEDHNGLREMAQAALQEKGYRVLLAQDGQEALDIFTARADEIALVVMDVIMPHHSGPEVYLHMKAWRPHIPVIFATGYNNETAALADAVEHGVTVLRKPYSPAALCRRVREVLDGANASTPSATRTG